jgi:hypothetical protein
MIAIAFLFVRVLCDCFKSRRRPEAEIRPCHVGGWLAVTDPIAVPSTMIKISYSGYRFPAEIIQ